MPEFQQLLTRYQRRFQRGALAAAVIVAAASGALIAVIAAVSGVSVVRSRSLATACTVLCAAVVASRWWRQWTLARAAAAVEGQVPGLENLVVTAAEVVSGRRQTLHPILQTELIRQALERLRLASPTLVRPLGATYPLAAGCALALVVILVSSPPPATEHASGAAATESPAPLAEGDFRIVVTPPPYTQRTVASSLNPASVVAIEGSRVRIEAVAEGGAVRLVDTDLNVTPFQMEEGRFVHEFTATSSRALVMQYDGGGAQSDRLVQLRVEPDLRPVVRVTQPAKDLMFSTPAGKVPVELEARDDLGLQSLTLRYTRVAGSGETFTFKEGELPLQIARDDSGSWSARGVLALEALDLQDGDTLVYRAIAADHKPGADPSASDSFVIEIGRLAGLASTGFALPADRERQAISQQMLIIKTERLHNERGRMPAEAFAEQARLLAMEQRMVKAEFVFMTGGEVADEIEEAEHAHELAEGRLENAAQVELLTAIREMSRAEARLNDADTTGGLEFERSALKALQRAFDRRRYLLRTLPERARIDVTRRLTGELADAQSSTQAAAAIVPDLVQARARAALSAVSAWAGGAAEPASLVASRVMAVDPSSDALQKVALQVSAARDAGERRTAAQAAQVLLVDVIRSRAFPGGSGRVPSRPLRGRLADELSSKGSR